MNPQQVIDYYGSQTAAADALEVSQPSIAQWLESGKIPEVRQYQIELATMGFLRADKSPLRNKIAP